MKQWCLFQNGKTSMFALKKSQNNLNLSKLYFSTFGMTAFKSNNKNKKYNALIKKTKYALPLVVIVSAIRTFI